MGLWLLLWLACTRVPVPDADTEDDTDSGVLIDSGVHSDFDLHTDTGTDPDPNPGDSEPLEGLGEISGDCGGLSSAFASTSPALFENTLELPAYDETQLSEGGAEVLSDGNLGGNSLYSEVFAYEVLYRCEGAALLKTEGEIVYDDPAGKKTDLLVEVSGHLLGVSVTRAFHYPPSEPFTLAEADELLTDKLADILLSAENASDEDEWERSVLHVLAWDSVAADAIATRWSELDATVRAQTWVVVTTTEGEDDLIY